MFESKIQLTSISRRKGVNVGSKKDNVKPHVTVVITEKESLNIFIGFPFVLLLHQNGHNM